MYGGEKFTEYGAARVEMQCYLVVDFVFVDGEEEVDEALAAVAELCAVEVEHVDREAATFVGGYDFPVGGVCEVCAAVGLERRNEVGVKFVFLFVSAAFVG